ncbi:MAG: glycoside hydrolase family 127 protein, partial [Planctomycetes bacterium]|nr:glycoside hydrolase family 127 protein [Planctomycetota bacterium]
MPEDFGVIDNSNSPNCKWRSVGLRSVKWTDGFWGQRFDQLREVTLPHLRKGMGDPDVGHVIQNFRIYAGLDEGEYKGSYWQDEWIHKWLEGASYVYAYTGDVDIDQQMDELIELIAQAQEPDGYVCCGILMYKERFVVPRRHELYNMGHLITAACAHHRATGKTNYLDIARKAADCLYNTFVP